MSRAQAALCFPHGLSYFHHPHSCARCPNVRSWLVCAHQLAVHQPTDLGQSLIAIVLQLSALLMEKSFRTLGCICTTLDFFVFPFLSLDLELLELPCGCTGWVSPIGLSVGCGDGFFVFASRSRRLTSSHWRAAFWALLSAGMKAVKSLVGPENCTYKYTPEITSLRIDTRTHKS